MGQPAVRRHEFVNTLLTVVVGLVVLFGAAPAGAIPTVSFYIADPSIEVGQAFDVAVMVDGVAANEFVVNFGFDVSLSPGLSLTGVKANELLFVDDSQLDPPQGFGFVPAIPGAEVPGGVPIEIATLSLIGNAVGPFTLGILSDIINDPLFYGLGTVQIDDETGPCYFLAGGCVFDLTHSEDIIINPAETTAVPEPATLVLLGSGLIGLAAWRRIKVA